MWVVVQLEGRDKLLIGCIYRSPNADDHNNTQMLNLLGRVSDENFSHIFIVGDFNCKNINWQLNITHLILIIFKQNVFIKYWKVDGINMSILRQGLGKGKIQVC